MPLVCTVCFSYSSDLEEHSPTGIRHLGAHYPVVRRGGPSLSQLVSLRPSQGVDDMEAKCRGCRGKCRPVLSVSQRPQGVGCTMVNRDHLPPLLSDGAHCSLPPSSCSSAAVVLQLQCVSVSCLLRHRWPALTSRVSDSVGLGWSMRICISDKFPGDAAAAG